MPAQLPLPLPGLPDPAAPKASRQTPEHAWLSWAAAEWATCHKHPMTVRWARDLAIVRPLLRLHDDKELKLRWQAFLRTADAYFAQRGWDIPSFFAAVDRYHGDVDLVPIARIRQLHQRYCDEDRAARDPHTGVDRRTLRHPW